MFGGNRRRSRNREKVLLKQSLLAVRFPDFDIFADIRKKTSHIQKYDGHANLA